MPETSPFAPFANFTATFTVAGDALVQDERGNFRPSTLQIIVTGVLEQKQLSKEFRRPKEQPRPGVDSRAFYLKGFLVSPRPLPPRVTPDSPCQAVFNNMPGVFVMDFTPRSPYLVQLGIDLVDELNGWFLPESYVPVAP